MLPTDPSLLKAAEKVLSEDADEASIKNLEHQTGVSRETARKHYHDAGRNYAKAYSSLAKHVMNKAGFSSLQDYHAKGGK